MTIYLFRIQPQHDIFLNFPITIQILQHQNESLTFTNLTDKLKQSLTDKVCLSNYNIYIGNSISNRVEIINDYTLAHALSILPLNKLEIYLQCRDSISKKRASIHYNTVPLIKPKVIRWDQYKYQEHNNTQQLRKDSGIELESHLFPKSTANYDGNYSSCTSNSNKKPSLDMLLSPNINNDEELPGISHSVDSSPSASPSTIASSSPSSPMIAFSNSAFAPSAIPAKSSKKCKGSSWPPADHSSSPVYFCEKMMENGKICGQTFQRPYDLARHQTIHLKNRPFVYCQQCGKRFTRVDALRRHERVQGHYKSQKHNRNYKIHSHSQHQHHHHHHRHSHHHTPSISVHPI